MSKLLIVGLIGLSACIGGRTTAGDAEADSTEAYAEMPRPAPVGEVLYGAELREANETDLVQAIVNRVAGARVVYVQGEPQLRLRPSATIYGNPNPLYVVDGMPMPRSGLSVLRSINVQDVDRIEILKYTGDTVLYGVHGGNGVIRVWTRNGFSQN